jgi:hypothetical protein
MAVRVLVYDLFKIIQTSVLHLIKLNVSPEVLHMVVKASLLHIVFTKKVVFIFPRGLFPRKPTVFTN